MTNSTFEKTSSEPRLEHGRPVFDSYEWLRLPPPGGRCPVVPLSRSTLSELVRPCARNNYNPPVEARVLRQKGARRGILLISRSSLLAYIAQQPTPFRQEETEQDGKGVA